MGCSVEAHRSRIGLFVAVLMKILTRNARKAAAKVRGLRVTSFSALLAVSCLLAMLLIGCVEPNPGPLTPTKHTDEPREHHSDTSFSMHKETWGLPNGAEAQSDTDASDLLQYLSSAVQAMTSAITRPEEGQRQLTSAMTQQFTSIQHSLDARLHQMGEEQHVLHLDVDELHNKQERLEQENANLRNTVQQLASKVEELDFEKRKRNLLFFGKPIREGVLCEQLVGDVLQTDLGITDNINMDQARRVGSGILVTFQSLKQKALVLSKARLLTPDRVVSIREDFPEAVRQRRGGLMEYYKQLRKDMKKAILRSDKLFTDNGVFTYDLQQQMIIRLDTPPLRQRQVAVNTRNTTNTLRAPDTANNNSDAMEGVTHADSDADKGQGVTATTKTSGNTPGQRGSIVTHTHTHIHPHW